MSLALLSFLAGMLSVLAPCILPVLPVILGGSLGASNRRKPLVIISSTVLCIVLFTVLLKVSTALINVPQEFWTWFSAVIIVAYGITLVRPAWREIFSEKTGLTKVNALAQSAESKWGIRWDILLGAALWPIFASCSPTYALLLSLVFPESFSQWVWYTLIYALGFWTLLLVIAYGGRALVKKMSRAANPNWLFKKALWTLLIVTGLLIATWTIKRIEAFLVEHDLLNATAIESSLLENRTATDTWSPEGILNVNYPAPELAWLTNWLNSDPLSLADLRWKVVIIDFRTYSCINCIRTLPVLRQWHEQYADKWLVIIGVHAPEFQFEKLPDNVAEAVKKFELPYPVAQDNDFTTRREYENQYRPAKYIIDREWNVRYTHFGEGAYQETEDVIQFLLGARDTADSVPEADSEAVDYSQLWTAETYLGTERRETRRWTWPAAYIQYDPRIPQIQLSNTWRLSGSRTAEPEYVELLSKEDQQQNNPWSLFLNFSAKTAKLVMWSADGKDIPVDIYADGVFSETITVNAHQLYTVFADKIYARRTIELRFNRAGVQAYAFTFG